MPRITDGPFIQTACFCETVIEDKTGVLSLIRIVDTLTHTKVDVNPPDDLPPFVHSMKLVLMLKAGAAKGRYNLRIIPELPNGSSKDDVTMTAHFDGEEKGQNFIADFRFEYTLEGLYWFHVFLDDNKLTSIPLRIKYNRVVASKAN